MEKEACGASCEQTGGAHSRLFYPDAAVSRKFLACDLPLQHIHSFVSIDNDQGLVSGLRRWAQKTVCSLWHSLGKIVWCVKRVKHVYRTTFPFRGDMCRGMERLQHSISSNKSVHPFLEQFQDK